MLFMFPAQPHRRFPARLTLPICLAVATPLSAQLQYADRSVGLEMPKMESGRTEIEAGDVNGDGRLDLICVGDHGSPFINTQEHGLMVWFGDGDGGWSVFQFGDFGYGGVALGDVNGDGLMDAGYGIHHDYSSTDLGDQILEVALGDGTGRAWTAWDDGLAANGEDYGMFGTDFADVDNDGDLDLGSISFGCCAGVHVYLNNGNGLWTQSFGFVGGNSDQIFTFGEINGDGNADFALSHQQGGVYFGDGLGDFTPADGNLPARGLTGRAGVSLGDVNGDGRDDLSFVNSAKGLAVWTWDNKNKVWVNLSGNLPVSGVFALTEIADMNLDGHGDLVAADNTGTAVYLGDGNGGWTLAASIPTAVNTCARNALRANGADLDHNGYPDIVSIAKEACVSFGGNNRPRAFLEATPRSATWIRPYTLDEGRAVAAGSARFIRWTSSVTTAPAEAGTVDVEVSVFGPQGPWMRITKAAPNNGRYQWHGSADLPPGDAWMRLTLKSSTASATALTSKPFSIVGGNDKKPKGDFDGDQDVDLVDAWRFFDCFTGDGGTATPGCKRGDFNGDQRIDLADFQAFQAILTGPKP